MVNFGLNSASILGIFLAVAGAGLYFMRSVRPELSRDHDIFFAAVGLLCGLILLFQGWRLDPILQFGQFLLTGAAIFFAVETVRLRGVTTEQAKRNAPFADEERRVSRTRVYTEAELDRLEPYSDEDNYESNRRLRGYAEPRDRRESGYGGEEARPSNRRRPPSRSQAKESPRQRRPRSTSDYSGYQQEDVWQEGQDSSNTWEDSPPSNRPRRPRTETSETSVRSPRSRSRRPQARPENFSTAAVGDYVDYQPIDQVDDWQEQAPEKGQPNQTPEETGRDRNQDNPGEFDY